MTTPWPFSIWGMDVIGPITPKSSNRHHFILVAINYFTKWVKVESYAKVTKEVVTRFVRNNLVCQFGLLESIISDNARNLNNNMITKLYQQFQITHKHSAPYRPKMNGAVEAANKNIKTIMRKMSDNYKTWHEMLPLALMAYRTSIRT